MFYAAVILLANIAIIISNVFGGASFLPTVIFSALGTVSVIAVDGITAFIIRRLPEKWFCADNSVFSVSRREKRVYSRLGVKKLNAVVPELGGFTNFHKDKLESTDDFAYLARFLLESNYGVVIHIVNALFGYLIGFLPFCGGASVWIPVATVNFALSMLPVFILRNNTPALMYLYKRSASKQQKPI